MVLQEPGSISSEAVLARQHMWQLFWSLQAFMWTEASGGAAYFISTAINKSWPNYITKQKQIPMKLTGKQTKSLIPGNVQEQAAGSCGTCSRLQGSGSW